jgi:peptidoglycan/xylan/chitin deacetylase (PgdA/CDA1 family)
MMRDLWQANRPQDLWHVQTEISDEIWSQAVANAIPLLGLASIGRNLGIENLLETILGEGQFGEKRYQLGFAKRVYYQIKPFFPQPVAWVLRRWYSNPKRQQFPLSWPIEPRYAQFQWEVIRQVIGISGNNPIKFVNFWPGGEHLALVLTHDVETREGQDFVRKVADQEEKLGFRSSFNFIPERYSIDDDLVEELMHRGFEVGIHGLKHDGKLYRSKQTFLERSTLINQYLKKYTAVGFRSPLTHRQPEWMQSLDIEYDSSFFDTDPYEPMPGGSMSIFPYFIGRFVELPYTLMQDYTLTSFLHETTPRIWMEKVNFLEQYHGMALVNSHPDYLQKEQSWNVYAQFLSEMKQKETCYHALPREVARWWHYRSLLTPETDPQTYSIGYIHLDGVTLKVDKYKS